MIDKMDWLLEGRILYVKYSGTVTFDEADYVTRTFVQMAKDDGHPPYVHLIGDSTDILEYEIRMKNVRGLLSIFSLLQRKPYIGWCCSINNTAPRFPAVQFITATAASALGIHLQNVATLEEGLSFLNSKDHTLPQNLVERLIFPHKK